jgi:hypothetical protein
VNCKGVGRPAHEGKEASPDRPDLCVLCNATRKRKNAKAIIKHKTDARTDLHFINCIRECLGLVPISANGPLT